MNLDKKSIPQLVESVVPNESHWQKEKAGVSV